MNSFLFFSFLSFFFFLCQLVKGVKIEGRIKKRKKRQKERKRKKKKEKDWLEQREESPWGRSDVVFTPAFLGFFQPPTAQVSDQPTTSQPKVFEVECRQPRINHLLSTLCFICWWEHWNYGTSLPLVRSSKTPTPTSDHSLAPHHTFFFLIPFISIEYSLDWWFEGGKQSKRTEE